MDRTRSHSWTLRLLAVVGAILFGALFLGASQALAVTPAGGEPTEIAQPTTTPPEPEPQPEPGFHPDIDDLVIDDPCWKYDTCKPECPPGVKCLPPIDPCAVDPELCESPTDEPKEPKEEPNEPKADIPTPKRIDAGGGSAAVEDTEWTPLAGAAFAMVLTGVGVGGWVLLRPERQQR